MPLTLIARHLTGSNHQCLQTVLVTGFKSGKRHFDNINIRCDTHTLYYTNKVVIVNSRYWNRKKLWGSSSTNILLLLALIVQNIGCRLIIMPRPYSNNLRWPVITHYNSLTVYGYMYPKFLSEFRFQYRLLTMTTFSEVFVYTTKTNTWQPSESQLVLCLYK